MLAEGKTTRIFRWRDYTAFDAKKSLTWTPFVPDHSKWVAKSGEKWIKSSVSVLIRTLNRLIGFLYVDSDIWGFTARPMQNDCKLLSTRLELPWKTPAVMTAPGKKLLNG